MSSKANLDRARAVKNDEFYTRFEDIESEMNAYYEYDHDVFRGKTILCPCDDHEWSNFTKFFATNFERFGLKKLISTSYVKSAGSKQTTLVEFESPLYDRDLHDTHGKLFILTHDTDGSGVIDQNDVEFKGYLKGDGDFRSPEVCALRDEADIIITNPPFSLFREFIKWIGEKKFIVLGNMNAIAYKEIFPQIMGDKIWLGTGHAKAFITPDGNEKKFGNILWYTNLDHGKRHEHIILDTMENNLRYNHKLKKKLEEYGTDSYPKYDNYNAIEVPFVECIPSDYFEAMGVPFSFMERFNPEQFEIVGFRKGKDGKDLTFVRERERESSVIYKSADKEESMRLKCEALGIPSSEMEWCNGQMGVPISFLDRYSPEQFEIVGDARDGSDSPFDLFMPFVGGKKTFTRLIIRRRGD